MGWDRLHCKWVATLLGTMFFFLLSEKYIYALTENLFPFWEILTFVEVFALCLMWCSFVGRVRTGCCLFCTRGALLAQCLGMVTTDLFLDTVPQNLPQSLLPADVFKKDLEATLVTSPHGMCLWPRWIKSMPLKDIPFSFLCSFSFFLLSLVPEMIKELIVFTEFARQHYELWPMAPGTFGCWTWNCMTCTVSVTGRWAHVTGFSLLWEQRS